MVAGQEGRAAPVGAPQPAIERLGPPIESDPATQALTRFFSWYLPGQGEADRYTAPGNNLRPVDPPACKAVELLAVGFDPQEPSATHFQVRGQVECGNARGHLQRLEYALELAQRPTAGRWRPCNPPCRWRLRADQTERAPPLSMAVGGAGMIDALSLGTLAMP